MSEEKNIQPFKMVLPEGEKEAFVIIHWDKVASVVDVGGGRIAIEMFIGIEGKTGRTIVEGSLQGFFEKFGKEYPIDFSKIC